MSENLKPCREECTRCGAYTGNAGVGEDSLFVNDIGPLCEFCYEYYTLEAALNRRSGEPCPTRIKYCPDCNGHGLIGVDKTCRTCNGFGFVHKQEAE